MVLVVAVGLLLLLMAFERRFVDWYFFGILPFSLFFWRPFALPGTWLLTGAWLVFCHLLVGDKALAFGWGDWRDVRFTAFFSWIVPVTCAFCKQTALLPPPPPNAATAPNCKARQRRR